MCEKRYDDILLISDLDGTLIPRYEMISEENIRALNAFTAAGGVFAAATGRTPESALPYLDGITVNAPSIFFNGAMLKDLSKNQVLETRTLDGDIWRTFAALGDIRLVLADRLYIVDEDTAEDIAAFTDPSEIETQEEYMAVVYNFVSWVQDSLMLAMLDGLDDEETTGGVFGGANGGANEQE